MIVLPMHVYFEASVITFNGSFFFVNVQMIAFFIISTINERIVPFLLLRSILFAF